METQQPTSLERLYLGDFEIVFNSSSIPKMILKKTSADEIQNSFNIESLRNRSALVHPHLLSLERFSVDQEKVEIFIILIFRLFVDQYLK